MRDGSLPLFGGVVLSFFGGIARAQVNPSAAPAAEPVSVIVLAVPNWNAPGLCCWQSGHVPLPSVQSALDVHGLGDWSQVPVPAPVQQLNGLPAEPHKLLRGHPAVGGVFASPSKQFVPAALMSRQKPQNTRFMPGRF